MENEPSTAIVKREFKGKIPDKYWQEVTVLHDNGFSTRKIAAALNEKYQEDFNYSQVISLLNFLNNQDKKNSIETEFLDEVQGKVGAELQRVEGLTVRFERIMEECELQKDYKTMFACGDRLIKLYEIKMKNITEARTNASGKQVSEQDRQELMNHVLKKLQLSTNDKDDK